MPASKSLDGLLPPPDDVAHNVDHFFCYKVKILKEEPKFPKDIQASVVDQFNEPTLYDIKKPVRLCNPLEEKEVDGQLEIVQSKNPDNHLVCYDVKVAKLKPKQPKHEPVTVFLNDLFEEKIVDKDGNPIVVWETKSVKELCVPATKEIVSP